jgi:hypothetical protein
LEALSFLEILSPCHFWGKLIAAGTMQQISASVPAPGIAPRPGEAAWLILCRVHVVTHGANNS